MDEGFKIKIINNKHIFEILDTKSEILVFTEIIRESNGFTYSNDIITRNKVIDNLRKLDKSISSSRFLAILQSIVRKKMLIRRAKGLYDINNEYIKKL